MSDFFDENRSYVLDDPELKEIGPRQKLNQWRHQGKGPAYYKLGRKVIYRGSDLNEYVRRCRRPSQFERAGSGDAA